MSRTSTADWVAGARALHQREAVRVIDDPFAALRCGGPLRLVLRFRVLEWLVVERLLGDMKPVTTCVLMRARCAEQALESALARGVAQYVIVGAGMDSFAFRSRSTSPPCNKPSATASTRQVWRCRPSSTSSPRIWNRSLW